MFSEMNALFYRWCTCTLVIEHCANECQKNEIGLVVAHDSVHYYYNPLWIKLWIKLWINTSLAHLLYMSSDTTDVHGTQEWRQNGELHRDGDLPAISRANGDQEWYQHGKLHRDGDLPAFIGADGTQVWYQHGKLHRTKTNTSTGNLPAILPAIIRANGTQEWYKDGRMHRDGDLPAVIYANGRQEWYQYGE